MTLAALLEELRKIDPLVYVNSDPDMLELEDINMADILQGCIQRACERQGWTLTLEYVSWYAPMRRWHAYISTGPRGCDTKDTAADSAAEALMAAYIAAVRASQ